MISQPIYVQIADTIRRKVELGVYAYGSRLPTEREFSENFGVNRITVRKALKLLVDEGLLISSQGRGTFVSQPKISSGMDTIQGTSSFLTDMGFAPSSKMLHTLRRKAGYYFAKKLGIPEEDDVYQIIRLRQGDGDPLSLEYTTIPFSLIPNIENYDLSVFSLSELYERNGITLCKVKQVLSIVKLHEPQVTFLRCKEGDYGFISEEIAFGDAGRPIEFSKSYYSGRKFNFTSVME